MLFSDLNMAHGVLFGRDFVVKHLNEMYEDT